MKAALVIGGSGFIGLNLIDTLLEQGWTIRVTRRRRTPTLLLRKRPVSLVEASLEEPELLRRAMDGCDAVFLTGAHYPRYSIDLDGSVRTGVTGVKNACDAALAAGVGRFVYTSSIAALGPPRDGEIADETCIPAEAPRGSVYRAVKWAMEREVDDACARGLPAVTLMPGGCIGPLDWRVGTGSLIVGVARGALPWWVDGTVNLIDVGDVARAHVTAAQAPAGERYCLGGHDVRLGTLLPTLAERYGGSVPDRQLSPDEARERADADERAAAQQKKRVAIPRELVDLALSGQRVSMRKAVLELGVILTPLDEALDRAYAWFVRHRIIPAREGQS